MSKHTKGSWHVSDNTHHGCRLIYGPDGFLVADAGRIPRRSEEEMDANARLIAAAPELYNVAILGKKARDCQRAYFDNRTRENLIASKQAEKEFDDALKAAFAKVEL
ncbi:hypothetical protein IAD21_00605 [Abditibacteriota bacterium]|nr:hypothetical protein IAD21_00605 [Abditibacteriota bacterium]